MVWVGTSGGVVRYDTKTTAYKLYDNKNGLLSNGIFWVGRIRGRLAAGTMAEACRCSTRRPARGRPSTSRTASATPFV